MTPTNLSAIPPRLSKMLLMLSSNCNGEVVAAARAINKTLQGTGNDWHDLVADMLPPLAAAGAHLEVRDVVQWCFSRRSVLSPRDREFPESAARQLKPLSVKQQKWLSDIVAKLGNRRAA
jgi:hypothetical protein